VYFHTKTPLYPLALTARRSIFQFTGGAILQKERAEKGSSRGSETKLARRSGNWDDVDGTGKALAEEWTADGHRKRGETRCT
jgi:hypothetical protein